MSSELVINSTAKGERIVLLKNKEVVEYHIEESEKNFNVGDIFLGVVRKTIPGLNAAFVDIGHEKDAFLHYLDLSPNVRSLLKYTRLSISKKNTTSKLNNFGLAPQIEKVGKINQVLHKNDPILVQIVKEPISTKGPRLSCELSIAGRYLVLVPFSDTVNVSKKIVSKEERKRLLKLIQSIKPKNFGVIIRTVAEGKEVAELDRDLNNLMDTWQSGYELLREAKPRDRIVGEIGKTSTILRDMLNESFDSIIIDDKSIYENIKTYIKQIAPNKEKIIKHYTGKTKVFEQFGIEKKLKSLFGKSVSLLGGGYLIIEHTEALHVIDVNSGNKSILEESQEDTAIKVNKEAVKEIARQLRVRDMGGIIIIDFIDMRNPENKKLIFKEMKDAMADDRAKHTILPLTRFGLMQITRQRVRPELNVKTLETCPTCLGKGKVNPTILISDTIENNIAYILNEQNEKGLSLTLHPYLYAYFTKGLFSKRIKWLLKYKKWVKIIKDSSLPLTTYQIKNKQGVELEI